MKPRTTLAKTTLTDGSPLTLIEHDGRKSMEIHGQQICGSITAAAEEELARLACAPFRPARQPKILLLGLGLGRMLSTVTEEIRAKRASFLVAEAIPELAEWHRKHLKGSPLLHDQRVSLVDEIDDNMLKPYRGSLHAILTHLDVALPGPRNRSWVEDKRWLATARDALQDGGLLAIAGSRRHSGIHRLLQRAGFEIAEHEVAISPNARRARMMPIWLGRKGRTSR